MVSIRQLFLLWLFLAALWSGAAWAFEIEATPGRLQLGLAESLQVQLKFDGNGATEPDYTPLHHDWEIIKTTEESRSRAAGGKMMIRKLILHPKSAGQKIIPPLCIGHDCSQPIVVEVRPGSTLKVPVEQQIILETEIDPQKIMVQGKAQLHVRLWLRAKYPVGELSEPELDQSAARIVKLRSPLLRVATRSNGLAYQLVERHYEIYPQRTGVLEIPPLFYKGLVVGTQTRFDPFRKDGMLVQVKSAPLRLEVSTLPEVPGQSEIPSATSVVLEDDWSAHLPEFVVGETVARTLRLIAEDVTAETLPELEFEVPDDFKIYSDRAKRLDQQGGRKVLEQTFRLIPTRPGKYLLPAVELSWWDAAEGELRREQLPARQIKVLPAALPESVGEAEAELPTVPKSKVPLAVADSSMSQKQQSSSQFWPWLSLGLAMGWLLTLFLMVRWRRKSRQTRQIRPDQGGNEQNYRQAVIAASRQHDPLAARQALVDWGQSLCSGRLGKGYELLYGKSPPELRSEMERLDKVLYGPANGQWEGQRLAAAVSNWRPQTKKNELGGLPDLYPFR